MSYTINGEKGGSQRQSRRQRRQDLRGIPLRDVMPIQELDSQLWNGVAPGNAAIVQTLLRHGADPNYRGYAGQTWVHRACLLNCLDQLDLLVDAGGSLTAGDDDRETPLHLAAREGHSVIVERLLALGSDSRQESDYGTPPDRAAYAGHASGMGTLPTNARVSRAHRRSESGFTGNGMSIHETECGAISVNIASFR